MYTVGCNTNVSGGAVNKREKEETERMEKEEEKGILFVCLSCMSPCGTTPLLSHTKTQKNIINMSLFCITSCRSHFIFFFVSWWDIPLICVPATQRFLTLVLICLFSLLFPYYVVIIIFIFLLFPPSTASLTPLPTEGKIVYPVWELIEIKVRKWNRKIKKRDILSYS